MEFNLKRYDESYDLFLQQKQGKARKKNMDKDKKATQRWKKPKNLECDGGKSLSFSLCSFLTTTVNAQILDSWSTRIRQGKTIIKTNWMLVWLTGVVLYFYSLKNYCQSKQTWCLHCNVEAVVPQESNSTTSSHLFFLPFPSPQTTVSYFKDNKSPGLCIRAVPYQTQGHPGVLQESSYLHSLQLFSTECMLFL